MKTTIISLLSALVAGTTGYLVAKKIYHKKITFAGQLVAVKDNKEHTTNLYLKLDKPVEEVCSANVANMEVVIKEID